MLAAPPFDAAAQARAKRIAAAAGKPRTQDAGLRAIHAVLHKDHFKTERRAWETYGTSMQRLHEWKKLDVAKLAAAQRTLATATAVHNTESVTAGREQPEETRSTRPKDQRLLSGAQWLKDNTPNLCFVLPGEVEQLDESAYQHSEGRVVLGWNERDGMGPRGAVAVEILYATFPGGPPGVVLVGSPVLSPNQRHFTRRLSVYAYSPDGDPNIFQPDVLLASLEPCCPCVTILTGSVRYPARQIEYDCPTAEVSEKICDDRNREREHIGLRDLFSSQVKTTSSE